MQAFGRAVKRFGGKTQQGASQRDQGDCAKPEQRFFSGRGKAVDPRGERFIQGDMYQVISKEYFPRNASRESSHWQGRRFSTAFARQEIKTQSPGAIRRKGYQLSPCDHRRLERKCWPR